MKGDREWPIPFEVDADADNIARQLIVQIHDVDEGREDSDIQLANVWATLAVAAEVRKLRKAFEGKTSTSPNVKVKS